jgi:hypothetical protein
MKSILVISLLTILRLGIPTTVLLLIGEAVKHHYENVRNT